MTTQIFDLSREYRKRDEKKWWITLAEQNFLSNIDSVQKIMSTPWYELIKKYWERELLESVNWLRDMDASQVQEVARAQAKLELAQRFTAYLKWHERN